MPIIYGGTNDGHCSHGLASWVISRRGVGNGFDSNNQRDANAVYNYYHSGRGTWGIYRAFFEFDTSGISSAPSSATLKIYGYSRAEGDLIVVKSEQGGTLAAGDFNSFSSAVNTVIASSDGSGAGTLAGVSGFTYSSEITTWSTSGYNEIALNSDALSDMASLDTFKICLMNHDNDYLDQAGTTIERNGVYWAEGLTATDPLIDYTAAVTTRDNAVFFGTNF